jgi:hypothetical protein
MHLPISSVVFKIKDPKERKSFYTRSIRRESHDSYGTPIVWKVTLTLASFTPEGGAQGMAEVLKDRFTVRRRLRICVNQ